MPTHPALHFFGDGSPSVHARGQTSPSLESTTQISGEVTTRSTKPVSSPGSTRSLTSASKLWPSRRHGLLVDGILLRDAVKLVEMTGPRKTGASLTFSASFAQPRARRRVLPVGADRSPYGSSCSCAYSWHRRKQRLGLLSLAE